MSEDKSACLMCHKKVVHDDPFVWCPKDKDHSKPRLYCSPHCRQRHEMPRCDSCGNMRPRHRMLAFKDGLFCSDHCIDVSLGNIPKRPATVKLGWYQIEAVKFLDKERLRVRMCGEKYFRPFLPASMKIKQVQEGERLLSLYLKVAGRLNDLEPRPKKTVYGMVIPMDKIWKLDPYEPLRNENADT